MPDLPTSPPRHGPAGLPAQVAEELHRRAEARIRRAGQADRTAAAYAADLVAFRAFLARLGRPATADTVTAADVVAYLELRFSLGAAASSLARYVAGIGSAYPAATKTYAVRRWMKDMRHRHPRGTAPATRAPFEAAQARAVVAALAAEATDGPAWRRLRALRDRAIFLVGFAAACRRSELAALDAMTRGQSAVRLENHMSFLRAEREGTRVTVTATPLTRGRRSQVWEGTARDGEGRVISTGRVRLLCLDPGTELAGEKVK